MRYLLFGGDTYYARGGAHDLIESFDDRLEAKKATVFIDRDKYDWFHVLDTVTGEIFARSQCQAHGVDD